MYNTMGWGLAMRNSSLVNWSCSNVQHNGVEHEYLHIHVSALRYLYKLNKEHKPLYIYIIVGYMHVYT